VLTRKLRSAAWNCGAHNLSASEKLTHAEEGFNPQQLS